MKGIPLGDGDTLFVETSALEAISTQVVHVSQVQCCADNALGISNNSKQPKRPSEVPPRKGSLTIGAKHDRKVVQDARAPIQSTVRFGLTRGETKKLCRPSTTTRHVLQLSLGDQIGRDDSRLLTAARSRR